jgi:phage terminase large subunit GpA-like protein
MSCPNCGSTQQLELPGGPFCAGCNLTAAKALEQAEEHRRHVRRREEHDRRAALVVKATRGMPMRARVAAAVFLLHTNGRLPNGEPWNRMFEDWCQRNGVVEQKALPV